ncbi:MAG: hypothetical protein ABMB14_07730 [Myxococcota bacterium]
MNRRELLGAAAALAVLTGASPRRTYLKAHRVYTRELVLYRDFRTALLLRATLLEPAFRATLAAERRRLVAPSDENHAAFVARMAEDGAKYTEVVFAADSSYDNADRFGPGDDRWNLRLIADGVEQELLAVERVREPSPLHEALYVQADIWGELWIARFGRTVAAPDSVELIVGSGYGNGSVRWDHLHAP